MIPFEYLFACTVVVIERLYYRILTRWSTWCHIEYSTHTCTHHHTITESNSATETPARFVRTWNSSIPVCTNNAHIFLRSQNRTHFSHAPYSVIQRGGRTTHTQWRAPCTHIAHKNTHKHTHTLHTSTHGFLFCTIATLVRCAQPQFDEAIGASKFETN